MLAIGIDAAEATYVRRLLSEGAMPALAALLQRGRWSRVHSPAAVGSGTV
ncbi:MAG: hypothetical protein QOJ69_583, partial [Actinomycetota bacterium]|nr:hypothetical protein [Actinomycetota bacterium]